MELSSPSTFKEIALKLKRRRVENNQCKKFIPEDDLFRVIADSQDKIREGLKGAIHVQAVAEVVDLIFTRARKVFGILVLNDNVQHIQKFIPYDQLQHNDLDGLLPLERAKLERIMEDSDAAEAFYETQWEFCAPRFEGELIPRKLDSHIIIPYIEEKREGSGGYGEVYKVRFHPSYQPKGFASTDEFVRKEQQSDTTSTYNNEVHVLSTLQTLAHPNILRLVACYTHGDKHNLVSPYITGGTLHKYLKSQKPETLTREKMFVMMAGLASAISALHIFTIDDETKPAYKGQHQDLWGDNILVDNDRFILSDFGLSSMKRMSQNSRTRHKGRKGYYQAPESADLKAPYQEHNTTRASDIFSLGCIFTDLLVYFTFGPDGTKKFREARRFTIPPLTYQTYHKSSYSHEAVDDWLTRVLDEDPSESIAQAASLIKKMLELDPDMRPKADEVTAIVYDCAVKAFSDKITKCFTKFEDIQEAVIERARYSSWALFQEPMVYITSAGATAIQKQFTSVVETLAQMLETLKSIGHSPEKLDHRSINEIRPLNLKLLNMLSRQRQKLAEDNMTTALLETFGTTVPDVDPNIAQFDIGYSAIVRRAKTKQRVMASFPVDSEKSYFINDTVTDQRNIGEFRYGTIPRLEQPPVHVLIETIQCHDWKTRENQVPRIKALCDLLESEDVLRNFRVPPFYGAALGEGWAIELIYKFPDNTDSYLAPQKPTSLYDLLKVGNPRHGPLESRLNLAAELAEALANFHDVSWFHKNLTSSNILFFPSSATPHAEITKQPYLAGFRHSRRDSEDVTEGPLHDPKQQRYHHPSYVDTESRRFTRFEPRFDRYSLGILLLEIGLWSRIEVIMRRHEKVSNLEFAELLRETKLDELSFHMGAQYADIVYQCLTDLRAGPGGYGNGVEISPSFLFKQAVVIPLRALAGGRQSGLPGKNKRKRSYHEGDLDGGSVRSLLRPIPPKF